MARQQRTPAPPPRRRTEPPTPEPERLQPERRNIDFDPKRISLPQIAIVGFLIGIFFHACVAFAILDDGSSSSKPSPSGGNVVSQETAVPAVTPTASASADRTDCNAIRADPTYHSEAERQWFLNNCIPR